MSMTRSDLRLELKGILGEAAAKFSGDSGAFDRHLDMAALALAKKTLRTLVVKLTVVADQEDYAAPNDLLAVKFSPWGDSYYRERKPWQNDLGRLPRLRLLESEGLRIIRLEPAPTAAQIAVLGSDYPVFYYAGHQIGETAAETTIPEGFKDLLLMRATAQALLELANSGAMKPVRLGSQGVGDMPKNGTPASLAAQWLQQFENGR